MRHVVWFAVFLFAANAGGDNPSFKCRPLRAMFACKAKNIDGLHPRWELKGRYVEWGIHPDPEQPDFQFYAPEKWTAIEMLVQTGENTHWLVKGGEVKRWRGKAIFRCINNAACSGQGVINEKE